MGMKNPLQPGGLVGDALIELGVPLADVAKAIGVSTKELQDIVAGRASISERIALNLEKALGITARTLLRMQAVSGGA